MGEGKGSLFNTTQTKGVMFDPDSGLDTVLEKCFGYPGYFAVESADVVCCGLLEEFQQSDFDSLRFLGSSKTNSLRFRLLSLN